jgi:predicted helicase
MQRYFDESIGWPELCTIGTGLTKDVPRFNAKKARSKIIAAEKYNNQCVMRFAMRPFDIQWCYYVPLRPLWREPRPDYWSAYILGDSCLVSRLMRAKAPEGAPLVFANSLCDYHMMPPNSSVFPVRIREDKEKSEADAAVEAMYGENAGEEIVKANLSLIARDYLSELGIGDPDKDKETAGLIWMHALAICYSPAYLEENADGIRQDWPRIPLPRTK